MRWFAIILCCGLVACGGSGGGNSEPPLDAVSYEELDGTWALDTALSDPVREPINARGAVLPIAEETLDITAGSFRTSYTLDTGETRNSFGRIVFCDAQQTLVTFRDNGCHRDDVDVHEVSVSDGTMALDNGSTLRVYVRVSLP